MSWATVRHVLADVVVVSAVALLGVALVTLIFLSLP